MGPISFPEQTTVLAKDQPEYQPLPVHITRNGTVVSCWRLSWWDRLRLLWSGRVWLLQMTFGSPLQPQQPQLKYPFRKSTKPQTETTKL